MIKKLKNFFGLKRVPFSKTPDNDVSVVPVSVTQPPRDKSKITITKLTAYLKYLFL